MAVGAGDELAGRVMELLAGLAQLASRPIFGGVGLYSGRRLFGVVYRGALYLRADEAMRRDLARRGGAPFRPYRGRVVTTFWEVPAALAGEKRRIRALARRALAASEKVARSSLAARPQLARRLQRVVKSARAIPPPGRRR
ncbi:MAG TPA: TfoX/Sxy family protein [Kofleriaceae bacterium]|nr:TfoX/Sxy family protein [Kofleriaceae bacterium]